MTVEEFERYMEAAEQLIHFARRERIHPFAAAIAGVALIRNALETMGGRVEWWVDFVRTGNLPGFDRPPSQNPPKV